MKLIGVIALTSKAVFHIVLQTSTGALGVKTQQAMVVCISAEMQQSCVWCQNS